MTGYLNIPFQLSYILITQLAVEADFNRDNFFNLLFTYKEKKKQPIINAPLAV